MAGVGRGRRLMLLVPAAFAATYTVDTDGEGDATTIAGGLALATDGDTVEVGPGTYVEYVTIEHDVHLVGTDATILGTGAGPVVRMTAGSLSGFSISGGAATAEGDDAGGGVRAEGDVTLGDLVVTGNTASRGGGLFLDGNVTVSDCVVSGNSAELGGGVAVAGGSVRIERSVFETNTAEYGGGL